MTYGPNSDIIKLYTWILKNGGEVTKVRLSGLVLVVVVEVPIEEEHPHNGDPFIYHHCRTCLLSPRSPECPTK